MRTLSFSTSIWLVLLILASTTFNMALGFAVRGISSPNNNDLAASIDYEGYDCLKNIISIFNSTLDTTYSPEQEKQVLLDMYDTTNGYNWYNQSGWNTPNQTSHCHWYGITCHNNTSYIKSIVIGYNNLQGFLPTYLWKLRNLLSLCIPGNPKLYGRMEGFIHANMSELRIIVFNGDAITGIITEEFGHLSHLERFLACPMNRQGLSGPLPENLGNLTQLRMLCLEGNTFSGQIPRSISQLKNVYHLNLRNSPGTLWGYLEDILSIPSMYCLIVSGVVLKGNITILSPIMAFLVLTGNQIKGTLPKKFPQSLIVLELGNNKLTGDIPRKLFLLPYITTVDMSQNLFTSVNNGASWPSNNRTKSKLQYVNLAANRNLTIDFHGFLRALPGGGYFEPTVIVFNMSFCDLSGSLPQGILRTFYSLTILDLRGNRFNGVIPEVIADYSLLTHLDLSLNDLSGDLPLDISSLMSLQHLDISGNPEMQLRKEHSKNSLRFEFTTMIRPQPKANFTCPEGRLTYNNGRVRLDPTFYEYKYCICDSGFYGEKGLCKKCIPGGTCQKPVVMSTNDLKPSSMKVLAGYWPSPRASNVTHLVRCPFPNACNPDGDCTCRLQTSSNLTSRSANRMKTFHITSCNTSCICHLGNTERFCSRCREGFFKTGGLCYPCPKSKDNVSFYIFLPVFAVTVLFMILSFLYFKNAPKTSFIIVTVEFIIMFVFTLLELMPSWVFKLSVIIFVLCMTNRGKGAHSLIKIGVFYIQILDSMVSTFDVWPRQVFAIQHYVSSFWNLNFASLSCEFSILFDPVGRFAFLLLLPLFCVISIGLYLLFSAAYGKFKQQEDYIHEARFKCRQLTMSCLNFAYFPIVESTVSVLRPCDNDQGVHFMPKTPWIECNSQTYHTLSIMGWSSVVFYVIGFPVLLFTLMAKFFRKRISMNGEEKQDMDSWLGSLYLQYKPKYQLYFEIVLVIRRLLLAVSLSILASIGSVQTVAVWLILIISAIIQFHFQPYQTSGTRYPFENGFAFVVLFVLSMSFMILRFAALGSPFAMPLVWSVMVVNGCVLVAMVSCILYLFGLRIPFRCIKRTEDNDRNILLQNPTDDYE